MDNLELNDRTLADLIFSLQKNWQSGKEKEDKKRDLKCSVRWTNSNERHFNADL